MSEGGLRKKKRRRKKKDAFGCDCGGVEMMERNRVGWGTYVQKIILWNIMGELL